MLYEALLKKNKTNNSSELKSLFSERGLYRDASFAGRGIEPIDLWIKKPFYGRIDQNMYPINLRSNVLNISEIEDTEVYCIDFVARAFTLFKRQWARYEISSRLASESNILELNPVKGLESLNELYEEYLVGLKDSFLDEYL